MAKILELCLSPDLGGLELHVKKLSHYIDATFVLNKKGRLQEYFDKCELIGRTNVFQLAKIIDENKIDIVHLHWTKDLPLAVFAKLISKQKPKIVQTRHMHMTRFKSDFYHKFLYKNVDKIIAVTNLVQKQIEKFIPAEICPQVERVYIGAEDVEVISFEQKEALKSEFGIEDEFIVSIVGRIEEAKGQHIVLEAVQKLRAKGCNVKALIIGHAMDEGFLQRLKQEFSGDIFTGFRDDVAQLMQLSDVVVLATKKETFGLVLIEAMKAGIAVVASNSGGPTEIIEDRKSGLLFESFDVDDLVQKLKMMMDDAFRAKLAQNGKQRADEMFDSKKQFEAIKRALEL